MVKSQEMNESDSQELELRILEVLRKEFRASPKQRISKGWLKQNFELADGVDEMMFERLKGIDALTQILVRPDLNAGGYEKHTGINTRIDDITRDRKAMYKAANQPEDLVSKAWRWARSNQYVAIGMIVVFVVGFVAAFVNQIAQLINLLKSLWE